MRLVLYSLPLESGRWSSFSSLFSDAVLVLVHSKVAKFLLVTLFVSIAYSNILGNVPGNYTPTQYYSVVIRLSFTFWTPIFVCATLTDFKGFFAHIFPQGAPIWMILLLPLVEFVSVMLRPLILVVRLATNLAAGHILLSIFSYFASLLPPSTPSLRLLLASLFVIEFFISVLQAYIFVALLALYIEDTVCIE
jgi:F-type H+-transporting ATPase subunit a